MYLVIALLMAWRSLTHAYLSCDPHISFTHLIEAFLELEDGRGCFPDPVVAGDEGSELVIYEPATDEFCINKDDEEVRNRSLDYRSTRNSGRCVWV